MNNDNIELLKLVELHHYDVDKEKTKIHVDPTTQNITADLFLNRRITFCPYCRSKNTVIEETMQKSINHCVIPKIKVDILFHQKKFKCKACGHNFMERNVIGENISIFGEIRMIELLRNPNLTFSEVAAECFTTVPKVINHFDKRVDLNRHHLSSIICFDEIYARRLTKTKYFFVMFDPIRNTLLDIQPSRLKEDYREFNLTEEYSIESIEKLEYYIEKFKKSKFQEFKDFGFLFNRWKYYIVNSFIRVNGKRMSNGPMESLNSRLKRIYEDANGFTNFDRFRNRAMFALNYKEPMNF